MVVREAGGGGGREKKMVGGWACGEGGVSSHEGEGRATLVHHPPY